VTAPVATTARWIGPADRPLLGWLTTPTDGCTSSACVILPPVGYEYWSTHRTLRALAERLAAAGHTVLRIDYDGTGDSAGDQWDDDRVSAWRSGVTHAAADVRALGATRVTVIGLRFGATLALLEARGIGADAVVAWAPVESGRRFVKELRLLGQPVPSNDGAIVVAGSVFPEPALSALAALDVMKLDASPAARVLVVERPDRPVANNAIDHIEAFGANVTRLALEGSELALDLPAEYATVPAEILGAITEWVGDAPHEPRHACASDRAAAVLSWSGARINEQVATLGRRELLGIVGTPADDDARPADHATVVFLNSGSETHIGPGRAWVEYARTLSAAGHTTVRVDFTGWGESPDGDHAPGRPYDAHTLDDTVAIVEDLTARGHERIVLVGLCASAWVALKAVLLVRVAGIIALNPQMYWKPGDPVEATMAETRKRRAPERQREERGGRLGLWTLLDGIGLRHRAATWLRALARRRTPVLLVFAEGDDGLEFFTNRVARSLRHVERSGFVEVVEVPGIDHSMHRHWMRADMVAVITGFLDRLRSP
jgi:pimeloyl-ACP methyl ester carboxylesterase